MTPALPATWSRTLTAERYPLPLSPLGWDNIRFIFDAGVRSFAECIGVPLDPTQDIARSYQGWIFANDAAFDFRTRFKVKLERAEIFSLLGSALRDLFSRAHPLRELKALRRLLKAPPGQQGRFGRALNTFPLRVTLGALLQYLRRLASDIRRTWPATLSTYQHQVAALGAEVERATTPEVLLEIGARMRQAMTGFIQPDLVIFAIKEIASLALVELAKLARVPCPSEVPARLGEHLSENRTLQFHQRLRALAKLVQLTPDEPHTIAAHKAFLQEFGHLASGWDIKDPTWSQDLKQFHAFLQTFSAVAPTETRSNDTTQDSHFSQAFSSAGLATSPQNASFDSPPRKPAAAADPTEFFWRALETDPFALGAARELTDILRAFMSIDEEHHFNTGLIVPATRVLVLKLGAILQARGVLGEADDIFWLTDDEVRTGLQSPTPAHSLVITRKQAWHQAVMDGPPEHIPEDQAHGISVVSTTISGSEPDSINTTASKSDKNRDYATTIFSGIGVSQGKVVGRVRHVAGFADFPTLARDHIMVIRSPDPFFAMVFPHIGGLITETGAILSHGAVAAREYKLPAVFRVPQAWKNLPEGALVELDGTAGSVRLLETPS
jgi:phosphohistidine swiveling domain-containing protein